MFKYSDFFQTLHDEQSPTGYLGQGTHYTILRAVVWHDQSQRSLKKAAFIDLAVIWDEDHDTRVINVIERLYFSNLLTPAIIVGERKGTLTIIVDEPFCDNSNESWQQRYFENVNCATQSGDDPWNTAIHSINQPSGIINDEDAKVCLYLKTIKMLWNLGIQPVQKSEGL